MANLPMLTRRIFDRRDALQFLDSLPHICSLDVHTFSIIYRDTQWRTYSPVGCPLILPHVFPSSRLFKNRCFVFPLFFSAPASHAYHRANFCFGAETRATAASSSSSQARLACTSLHPVPLVA